jgi:hypothetical protein
MCGDRIEVWVKYAPDGTIADTNEVIQRTILETLERETGTPWALEALLPHWGLPLRRQLVLMHPSTLMALKVLLTTLRNIFSRIRWPPSTSRATANVTAMLQSVEACLDLSRLRNVTMSEYLVTSL